MPQPLPLVAPARRSRRPRLALLLIAALFASVAAAGEAPDEATRQLLVDAVEAAFDLDLYNNRCRSDQSGRHSENLNKELASRMRMTVMDVEDDLFPEGYYRDAQARMERDFLARLREAGGCAGAKEAELRDALSKRYEAAMDRIGEVP